MTYSPPTYIRPDLGIIQPLSDEALGARATRSIPLGAQAALTWTANQAMFVPFGIARPFLVREVWWYNSTAVVGNVDVGVYTPAGSRLFSLGSTARGAASSLITSSGMTDYTLAAGDYYLAFACDNATAATMSGWVPTANILAAFGVGQMASAFALPSSATIVPSTTGNIPYFGLNGFTVAI